MGLLSYGITYYLQTILYKDFLFNFLKATFKKRSVLNKKIKGRYG